NLARLALPLMLGWAINELLRGCWAGLALFLAHGLLSLGLAVARRMFDTRAFCGIYTDLASSAVVEQRRRGVSVSQVAARSALSRQVVDFFERDVPFV